MPVLVHLHKRNFALSAGRFGYTASPSFYFLKRRRRCFSAAMDDAACKKIMLEPTWVCGRIEGGNTGLLSSWKSGTAKHPMPGRVFWVFASEKSRVRTAGITGELGAKSLRMMVDLARIELATLFPAIMPDSQPELCFQ